MNIEDISGGYDFDGCGTDDNDKRNSGFNKLTYLQRMGNCLGKSSNDMAALKQIAQQCKAQSLANSAAKVEMQRRHEDDPDFVRFRATNTNVEMVRRCQTSSGTGDSQ